ncbi:MAG: FAD-dependent oxidoreductase [Oscillospiraceae bacterium]|nr:FAD-dependent oxidoreductase [Oscillospiraceae bacterium]
MEQIKLTINGREVTGNKGQSILEIAIANGISIPNLCYNKNLKVYGACGLCVVEVEKVPKLLRACATVATDGMVVTTNTPRVMQARKIALELLMSDHEGDCKGPCHLNCPARTDIQGYVKQIALGNDTEAVKIIKDKISLPASIGRVCPHPCEEECRRQFVEQPLSIAYLKAFAADNDMASADPFKPVVAAANGKKVGIVGGGPAGLNAAYQLAVKGYAVTVMDMMPEMGGMLRYGIPEYRLPKAVLAAEIKQIEALGVTMCNNVKVGKDVTLEALRESYDAVLVAVGAWKSTGVGCEGDKLDGVLGGIDVLREVNLGARPNLGKNVAVVGGGNVAMDACRTAVRLGAENVYVIYRRTRAEAPAEDLEIEEAIEEGVDFKWLTNPAEIIGENGKVTKVKLQVMELGEPDASGRRSPVPVEGKFEILDVDTVISAIGQRCALEGFEALELTKKGTIVADEAVCTTNLPGVFAAGDATNRGPSIAVRAIGEANDAAAAIDAYLSGKALIKVEPYYSKRNKDDIDFSAYEKKARAEMSCKDPAYRKGNFDAVINGFTEEQARQEAARCLECGCHDYEECRLIDFANNQPINPSRLDGGKHSCFKEQKLVTIERDQGKCILCNMCVRTCREEAQKGILGLVHRGFQTVIKPEFMDPATIADCVNCHKCADVCPTGALKILK